MNPYGPPKSKVEYREVVPEKPAWLDRDVRLAIVVPPLLVLPVELLIGVVAALPIPSPAIVLMVAYVVQITYGTACYLLLRKLRALNLVGMAVASVLPFGLGALLLVEPSEAAHSFSLYAPFGLAVAAGSWYFAVFRKRKKERKNADERSLNA